MSRRRLYALAVLAALVGAGPALAQELPGQPAPAAAEEKKPEPPPVIDPAGVAGAAEAADLSLREIKESAEPLQNEKTIGEELPKLGETLRAQAAETDKSLPTLTSLAAFNEVRVQWQARSTRLATEREALTDRAKALDEQLARLEEMRDLWKRSRSAARESGAPSEVVSRASAVLASIDATERTVKDRRSSVLKLQSGLADLEALAADVRQRIDVALAEERGRLWVRDRPPLWAAFSEKTEGTLGERLRDSWERQRQALLEFVPDAGVPFVLHLVVLGATFLAVLALRRRAARWAEEDPELGASARILRRPLSAALVVAVLVTPWLYPGAPGVFRDLIVLMIVVPLLRLLPGRLFAGMRPALVALVVLFVFDRIRGLLDALPILERVLLTAETLGAIGFLAWLLRPSRVAELGQVGGWLRAIGIGLRLGLVLFSVSFLANLIGNVNLARLLTVATLTSYLITVVLYAAAKVLDGLVSVGLRTRAARGFQMVRNHGPLLRRRSIGLVHAGLVVFWVWLVLNQFAIRDDVLAGAEAVFTASLQFGELAISLGDVALFGLTIWGALLFSRLLRFVLDEDVMPRLALPRGVPYAVSYILHYSILLFGFLLAAAAAGFDMSRFALLIGALGVGIGFGLQNVVNNFISGLILLFERPVQVGDTIQVGELFGEVRRIGIRSSTVRTWQGAEVIVPNGNLISEQVVNWTLSDKERRIEIPVGVAYGTDPERVLALLREVGSKHPDVLPQPEPAALFLGFGDSSLNFELRVWTGRSDRWMVIKSELTVAINQAIVEAGIEIPFPQRDLHLKSVRPEVEALVTGKSGER